MGAEETRKRIEELVARIQDEILDSSRRLTEAFSREAERSIPATGQDITKLVDEAFDFAQRVIESQRRMVSEVLANMDETLDKAPGQIQEAAKKATGPAKKALAKGSTAKKPPAATTATKAPAKKAAAKKKPAATKKPPAKKAAAKK